MLKTCKLSVIVGLHYNRSAINSEVSLITLRARTERQRIKYGDDVILRTRNFVNVCFGLLLVLQYKNSSAPLAAVATRTRKGATTTCGVPPTVEKASIECAHAALHSLTPRSPAWSVYSTAARHTPSRTAIATSLFNVRHFPYAYYMYFRI